MQIGARGTSVRELQRGLRRCGYRLTADGAFGPLTLVAARQWLDAALAGVELHGTVPVWAPSEDGIAEAVEVARGGVLADWAVEAMSRGLDPIPDPDTVPGIDVSGHQGPIQGSLVARAGARFVIVKLTEGTYYRSAVAEQQLLSASEAGMLIGGYHFPGRARREGSVHRGVLGRPDEEAAAYLEECARRTATPQCHALDGERVDYRWSSTRSGQWWLAWLEAVEDATGARPYVYCARWAVAQLLAGCDAGVLRELGSYPLWWSEYGPQRWPRKPTMPWADAVIHQYAGVAKDPAARWPGVRGACDCNRMARPEYERLRLAIASRGSDNVVLRPRCDDGPTGGGDA